MAKRFKTKQEFGGRRPGNWHSDGYMDYLYGLPWNGQTQDKFYPDLNTRGLSWSVSAEQTTEDPHPQKGKEFLIMVGSKEQSETAQKKLFALGYGWGHGGKKVKLSNSAPNALHINYPDHGNNSIGFCSQASHPGLPRLTCQQFMDGDAPTLTEMECPAGYDFGEDFDSSDEDCNTCPLRQECLDATFPKTPSKQDKPSTNSKKETNGKQGKSVKVQRPAPAITRRERARGSAISGRGSRTATCVGHLSHQAITG